VDATFRKENMEERGHQEDLDVDGRIILKRILENRMEVCGLNSPGSEQRSGAVSRGHGSDPWRSIKCWELLELLNVEASGT
jgi:hypothetical protein